MEKRSVEIYRPPEDIKKTVENKDDVPEISQFLPGAGVEDCLLHTKCVNLDSMDVITQDLEELTETIGHELNKIQVAIIESTEHMRGNIQPVVKDLVGRRADIQDIRILLEKQLVSVGKIREDMVSSAENPTKLNEDYSKILNNINNAQKILNVRFLKIYLKSIVN